MALVTSSTALRATAVFAVLWVLYFSFSTYGPLAAQSLPLYSSTSSQSSTSYKPSPNARSSISLGDSLDAEPIVSPSGRYHFGLQKSGQLALTDRSSNTELFTSDTALGWPVRWHAELAEGGILELSWTYDNKESDKQERGRPWVSSLLPGCQRIPAADAVTRPPVLELLDSGLLRIQAGSETLCTLNRATDDHGRLAIVYPGFLRTYAQTCTDHNKKIVKAWKGSGGVDVHFMAYYEDSGEGPGGNATAEEHEAFIRKTLEDCFGSALKTVTLHAVADSEEAWVDAPEGVKEACKHANLDRHISQFKTIYLASQQLRKYMIENAVQYDYVMKLRPDLALWGDIPPFDPSLVPAGGILAPRVALDWVWYALQHDERLVAGVTDIAAVGRPAAMFSWMDLYREFKFMRTVEKGPDVPFPAANTHQQVKTGMNDAERCTPENILAYWLGVSGITVKTDWRWQMALLREDGEMKFSCPEKDRKWNCPGFVPQ